MYTLSACVEWLFADVADDFHERLYASAEAGFTSVEFWGWQNKNLPALIAARDTTGLSVTSFISEPRGQLADPASHVAFLKGVETSTRVANELHADKLVVTVGDSIDGVGLSDQLHHVCSALKAAADLAGARGIDLLVEPLNSRVDHPGRLIDNTALAIDVIREVNSSNLRLLYDMYHSIVMGEIPSVILQEAAPYVGHVQVADVPGRNEPGSGDVDWSKELIALRRSGYAGRIGLEYRPTHDTLSSLDHIRTVLAAT